MTTLLQLCTDAIEGIGSFNVPGSIFNNDDDTAIVLRRAAMQTGRELVRKYDWQALLTPTTITTVSGKTQYPLPSDFRKFANLTFWDEDDDEPLIGPLTPMSWAELTRGILVNSYTYSFRIAANYLEITPSPPSGATIGYDYYSANYSTTSGGTAQANWAADNDLPRLDDDLFVLGIRYRFLQRKELPYAEDKADYLEAVSDALFNDTPKAITDMSGLPHVSHSNLPDGSFGV